MKKIICAALCVCLLLSAAGCANSPAASSDDASVLPAETTVPLTTAAPTETTAPETEPSVPETTEPEPAPIVSVALIPQVEEFYDLDDDTVKLVTYTWQDLLVTASNGVGESITQGMQELLEQCRVAVEELQKMAKADYPNSPDWRGYSMEMSFSPERVDSTVISLSGVTWSFTGGVHPNSNLISISFDSETGNQIVLEDLVINQAALDTLFQLVMDQLAEDDGLYPDYEATVESHFDPESPASTSFYLAEDGICFYFSPYEIAPYARGAVEALIPYEKLEGVILDCWLPAAAEAVSGSLSVDNSQMADIVLTLDETGTSTGLLVSGTLTDFRIQIGSMQGPQEVFHPIYAADVISDGMRIGLAVPADPDFSLWLSYLDQGNRKVFSLTFDGTDFVLTESNP